MGNTRTGKKIELAAPDRREVRDRKKSSRKDNTFTISERCWRYYDGDGDDKSESAKKTGKEAR